MSPEVEDPCSKTSEVLFKRLNMDKVFSILFKLWKIFSFPKNSKPGTKLGKIN